MKYKLESLKKRIDVWNIRLPDHRHDIDMCRASLNGEELARAAKFLKPDDAESFILCRGLLRRILADCLDAEPSSLCFSRNAQGKPFLENSELEFNVSHSRDRLLVAVTAGRAVGVDIEFRRSGLRMESIAKRWFSPEEQTFFQGLENPEKGFFEIWAKKEAYVKALGMGIYQELNTFSVPLGVPPGFPNACGAEGAIGNADASGVTGSKWFFQILEIDSGYAAAVVSEVPVIPVHIRTL